MCAVSVDGSDDIIDATCIGCESAGGGQPNPGLAVLAGTLVEVPLEPAVAVPTVMAAHNVLAWSIGMATPAGLSISKSTR